MGKRVHVAKRYEVEYGSTEAFNWAQDKFVGVLNALGCSAYEYGSEDDNTAGGFEVPADDYKDAVENLAVYISDPTLLDESDDIRECLEKLGMTADELLKTMKDYQQEADTRDGYLHFMSY